MKAKNIFLLFLVLIIVLIIWFYQNLLKEHRTELPLEIRFPDLPEDTVVIEIVPEEINLIVEGRGIDIFRFNRSLYYLNIDTTTLNIGHNEFTATEQQLHIEEPHRHIDLRFHLNKRLTVILDRSVIRSVPVTLRYMTEQDELFFQQRNASPQPATVEIVGPNTVLTDISTVTTVPLSEDMVTEPAELTVELEIPEGILGIKPDVVDIELESPAIISRTIPLINIEYPGNRVSIIIPQTATVRVEGTADIIQRLRPQAISAYLDIPEDYEYDFAPVQIRVPDNIRLIDHTPQRVQVFYHE